MEPLIWTGISYPAGEPRRSPSPHPRHVPLFAASPSPSLGLWILPVRLDRAEIAGQKIAIPVERLCIEFRRPIIAWRDVAADGELADFAFGQGPPGNGLPLLDASRS